MVELNNGKILKHGNLYCGNCGYPIEKEPSLKEQEIYKCPDCQCKWNPVFLLDGWDCNPETMSLLG